MSQAVRAAWSASGRSGKPRLVGICYFALSDDAQGKAASFLGD